MRTRNSVTSTALFAAAVAVTGLTACGGDDTPEPSVEAFCQVIDENRTSFNAAMDEVTSSDFSSGLSGISDAFSDLGDMWPELEKVSPDDIRDDVAALDDAFGSGKDEEDDDDGGFLSGLSDAFDTGTAAVNLDNYVIQNCDS